MKPSVSKPTRRVSTRVHAIDRAAEAVISAGGFLVLAAVLGICLYLAYVVVPLFSSGSLGDTTSGPAGSFGSEIVLDPYGRAFAVIDDRGAIRAGLVRDGSEIGVFDPDSQPYEAGVPAEGEPQVSAISVIRNGEYVAYGYTDGSVRLGSIRFTARAVVDEGAREVGDVWTRDGVVYESTRPGRARRSALVVDLVDPVSIPDGAGAVERIDYRVDSTGRTVLLAGRADGTIAINSVRTIRPLGGGKPRTRLRSTSFRPANGLSDWSFVTAEGDSVLLLSVSGAVERYARGEEGFVLAERLELLGGVGRVADAEMLLGSRTLLVGDDSGVIASWSVSQFDEEGTNDAGLVRTHRFQGAPGAILDMAPSTRDRSVVVLGQGGDVRVRHATSEKTIVSFETDVSRPVVARFFPKNDALMILGEDGSYATRAMEAGYPEFSVKALFGKVHYEGQAAASFVYQSSAGEDAAETKLSLMPLIFGTLKATVFAMIFAVPIGVLAAVYTSEFLSHGVRRAVKPGVEMMASLPSVVLGFIAAMVVAPYVRDWLPQVLVGLVTVPLGVLLGAHLWQLVPLAMRRRLRPWQHMMLVLAACGIGILGASAFGGSIERLLFVAPDAGPAEGVDMRRWLNGEYGGAWSGWFAVLVLPSSLVAFAINTIILRRPVDALAEQSSAITGGVIVLVRFGVLVVLTCLFAALGAWVLSVLGFDARDSILGTFSPRNTLVVAMIMGFAVIPIIYTISDDALQAVPDTLRAASLGAGATQWQTAVRIVLPVAASGIFSACMIGFGRAVGETMIVLMATGNTPEMSWNIFGGFRTLAANIAVELPEAPKGETHYRVLFLCGFVLFVMTFVINTTAEVVRQVVRARNAGL
ncbi:MAG: ABC transporter permease subunit [Planctomycetota bacterium]